MVAELYAQIMTVPGVAECFDLKVEDGYQLTDPIIVSSLISDTPATDLSRIAGTDSHITLEIQAVDLTSARTVKAALISALHSWSGGPISACQLESAGPELYDADLVPPRYCLPVDFMIST